MTRIWSRGIGCYGYRLFLRRPQRLLAIVVGGGVGR